MTNFQLEVPEGDSRKRLVCGDCGFINYENPKIVAGVIVEDERGILLCKRAIEPRRGYWTLPAGFIECEETPAEGAAREAQEEACADVEPYELLGLYTVRHISQLHMYFRAHLKKKEVAVGPESLEVGFFKRDEIPWEELSFRTVRRALLTHLETDGPIGAPDAAVFEVQG